MYYYLNIIIMIKLITFNLYNQTKFDVFIIVLFELLKSKKDREDIQPTLCKLMVFQNMVFIYAD